MYDRSNLQSYFERCVIGGPDAFTIGVTEAGYVRHRSPSKAGA